MADSLIVKLGADTSEFKGQIAGASNSIKEAFGSGAGGKIGEDFTKSFERKLGVRDVFKSAFVAIGIDAQSIAERIARAWTGVSKEEEAAYKQLGELSERVADANIAAMRASLSEEKKYQLALREREGAIKRIADIDKSTAKGQVELKEQELRLAQNSAIIAAYRLQVEKQTNDEIRDRIAVGESDRKANLDNVALLARRIALQKDDVILAQAGVDAAENQSQKEAWLAVLKQRQVQLGQMEAQFKKEHALTLEQVVEFTKLEADLQIGKILPADRARLEQLKLISKEKENQGKIDTILGKPAKERTEQEKITLGALNQQNKELDAQIARYDKIIQQLKTATQEIVKQKQGDFSDFSGDSGVIKTLSGFATYNDPAQQRAYEKQLIAQARSEIQDQIDELHGKIDAYLRSGSSLGQYELPALRQRLNALQSRKQNVEQFVFNPNYSDKAGQGIFASQVSTIGDPLGLQKKQTDTLANVASGIAEINNRLRMAGLGTGG